MKKMTLIFLMLSEFLSFSLTLFAQDPHPEAIQNEMQKLTQWRTLLQSRYREMDSYLDVLFISLLAKQHVLAFGGPGGSKTETAKAFLEHFPGRLFNLQFSPSTKEEQIKGTLIGKKYLEEGRAEYHRDQSLLMHDYAILDEIDKAGPEVLAAALSVLNERKVMAGDEEVLGALKSALITSNMTLHEFLQKFRNTNDEPTGKALLDRIQFKVLVLNHLSSAEEMLQLLSCKRQPCPDLMTLAGQIDLPTLQEKIKKMDVPQEVTMLATLLWRNVRKALQKEQLQEQRLCQDNPLSLYTMTNQFSTRGFTNLLPILKIAKFLEDSRSSGERQNTLRPEDIWLTHYAMIMQGPGAFEREHSLNPGKKLLKKLKDEFEFEPRTLKMLQDLEKERNSFAREYESLLKGYQDELSELNLEKFGIGARELADLLGKDLSTLSPEKKAHLSQGIHLVRSEIERKRQKERELNEGELPEGSQEVARVKVLAELEQWEHSLQISPHQEEEIQRKMAEQRKQEEEESIRRAKVILEKQKANPFPPYSGLEVSFKQGQLYWSKASTKTFTYLSALTEACLLPARLPTKEEYEYLSMAMGTGMITGYRADTYVKRTSADDNGQHANFDQSFTWTADQYNDDNAWTYDGEAGEVIPVKISVKQPVRCVIEGTD